MSTFIRPRLIVKERPLSKVADDILAPIEGKATKGWKALFGLSLLLLGGGGYFVGRVWWDGIGLWGENKTINWAWDITNFVWWIGIGHAGTLISAILLLFRQKWRNSINRSAEAMTLCAITCSSLFIFAHLGRVWVAYWMFPMQTTLEMWPNFNSALVWDAFAILTYLILSTVFWYIGLIPDLAIMRERAKGFRRKLLGYFTFGWENSAWHWRRYRSVNTVMSGLLTALVVSVHSIVSFDFATTLIPGWHTLIFPPYFVVGAILSGMAMVITILVPLRKAYSLENYITKNHLEPMNKIILLMSGLIGIAYLTETMIVELAHNPVDVYLHIFRSHGKWNGYYYLMHICNFILPQLLWFRTLRRSFFFSFILSLIINLGMWSERFVIIVTSLARDYLPSAWAFYRPTPYTIGTFVFSIGLFMFLFLLFLRFIPVVSITEMKELVAKENEEEKPL